MKAKRKKARKVGLSAFIGGVQSASIPRMYPSGAVASLDVPTAPASGDPNPGPFQAGASAESSTFGGFAQSIADAAESYARIRDVIRRPTPGAPGAVPTPANNERPDHSNIRQARESEGSPWTRWVLAAVGGLVLFFIAGAFKLGMLGKLLLAIAGAALGYYGGAILAGG